MSYYPNQKDAVASHYAIVVIGTSLGGLRALQVLLAGLPKSFPLPVVIAQHRHKHSDETLSIFLQQQCALPVTEAEDKQAILPGRVYIAPADYHLLVESGHFALSTEAPVCYARPSINVLFESAADSYGQEAIGVILTGASNDGTQGLLRIKSRGGVAVVQEPTTAECPTMPKAAMAAVAVDWIVPLGEIAPLITKLCQRALR
jgi:two-component system, chemotaxis family, protein-glutamate methylesterase/glutaminase